MFDTTTHMLELFWIGQKRIVTCAPTLLEILAPGHVLLALDGHESQGQSGWFVL